MPKTAEKKIVRRFATSEERITTIHEMNRYIRSYRRWRDEAIAAYRRGDTAKGDYAELMALRAKSHVIEIY